MHRLGFAVARSFPTTAAQPQPRARLRTRQALLHFGEGKRPTIYYRLHNEPLSLVGGRVIFQGSRVVWVTGRHLEADGELVLRPGQREMTALALLGDVTQHQPETGGVMTAHWPERRLYIWLRGSFTDNWDPWRTSEFTLY